MRIGFKTRGGDNYGFGHIARTQLLIRALRRLDATIELVAAIDGPDWVKTAIRDMNVRVEADFSDLAPVDVAVVDMLDPEMSFIQEVRRAARKVVAFSDMEAPVPGADIIIEPQTLGGGRTASRAVLSGPSYFSIAERFLEIDSKARIFPAVARCLLVNLGGEAHADTPGRIASLLETIGGEWDRIAWITGRGCPAELRTMLPKRVPGIQIAEFVDSMPELLSAADVAVVAGGFIKWEAAYCGTPMIVTALVEHQEELGRKFSVTGAARYAGYLNHISIPALAEQIRVLQHDPDQRKAMSERGRRLIDGRGSERVATAILELAR